MKKKTKAFTNFLDTKYIPIQPKIKAVLAALLFIIPAGAFYFFFLQSSFDNIERLNREKKMATTALNKAKARARKLPKLEEDLAKTQEEFDQKAILLPREKEIPQLLRDISSLGRNAGLDFLVFQPQSSIKKDFYDEIPVKIDVRGPYHNVGFFLDQVSKLERIVSVSNISMGAPKNEAGEILLKSNCRLVTYQFTNQKLPEKKKKK